MFLDIYRFDEDRNKSRESKEKATIKLEELRNLMLNKIDKWEQYQTFSQIFQGSDIEAYRNHLNSIYQTYPEANREILDIWFQNVTRSLKCDELSGLVYRMPINEFVESMP